MLRAVIVDDERPSLRIVKKVLEKTGLVKVVMEFTNPLKALGYLESSIPDVVFLDVEMPDQDGIVTANMLLEMHPHLPIVFITAYTDYAVDAFKLNAIDYLVKPITANRVEETIMRILHQNGQFTQKKESFSVQTFGSFSIVMGDERLHFRTRKAEELLCYLIDSEGEFVSREHLADQFWGDFSGDKAVFNLNTTLHYIKKALAQYTSHSLIESDRGRYRICIEFLDCDFMKFKDFSRNINEIRKDNLESLFSILSIYKGSYLKANDYRWALQQSIRFETLFVKLVQKTVELLQEKGIDGAIQTLLWESLAKVPESETLTYLLIKSLLKNGDKKQAHSLYETYRTRCIELYDCEPANRFTTLFA